MIAALASTHHSGSRAEQTRSYLLDEVFRVMRIDTVPIGADPPHEVNMIVEVPVGGEPIKYEMNKDAGTLVVNDARPHQQQAAPVTAEIAPSVALLPNEQAALVALP